MIAENTAPTRKKIERPTRSAVVSAGRMNSRTNTRTAKIDSVRNWRERYAAAPSCTAAAISFMFSVPSLAARTSRASTQATPSAAMATSATTYTRVRFPPETVTPLAAAMSDPDIHAPWRA
ncbi:MAG: hypothetical protein U0S36_06075 [Candidatus Nanopelagicales bacterium]